MKSDSTVGIVIRRTNYSEYDRIVTFITPLGQKTALAKGVRKLKSKMAGGIELLSESELVFRYGKGELAILTQARMKTFYQNILADYDRLQFAYEAMKVIDKSSRDIDSKEWFEILKRVLEALNRSEINLALIKAWFYLHVSRLEGEEINLFSDLDGQALIDNQTYRYDFSENAFVKDPHGQIGSDHIKLLRIMSKKSIFVVAQVGGIEKFLTDILYITRRHISF